MMHSILLPVGEWCLYAIEPVQYPLNGCNGRAPLCIPVVGVCPGGSWGLIWGVLMGAVSGIWGTSWRGSPD
jgi:hypothetical protein